jgi:predicted amidophosphoribosyltransferase
MEFDWKQSNFSMRLPPKHKTFITHGLSLIAPPFCPMCAQPAAKHALAILCTHCRPKYKFGYCCQACGHRLPNLSWLQEYPIRRCRACQNMKIHFSQARALKPYSGTWKKTVLHYKISPSSELSVQFAALCYHFILRTQFAGKVHGISPVPKRRSDLSAAEQLARALAKRIQIEYVSALRFKRKTLLQHTLRRQQRLSNMKNSMQLNPKQRIQGTWLLVDDIYTTGATVNEGARVLREAGAVQVNVITLARGLDHRVGLV